MEFDEARMRQWRQRAEEGDQSAMVDLALFLIQQGAADEAETWYRRAAGPGDIAAVESMLVKLWVSRLPLGVREMEEAESWYRHVAEAGDIATVVAMLDVAQGLRHSYESSQRVLGDRFMDLQGWREKAEAWYRRAADTNPDVAALPLARFLSEQGAMEEAESWYRQAAETDTDMAAFSLARFLSEQGAMEEAESWYRRAAAGDTDSAVYAMAGLAQLLHERGAAEDALTLYVQALEKDDERAANSDNLPRLRSASSSLRAWATDLIAQERFDEADAVFAELERQEERDRRIRAEEWRRGMGTVGSSSGWGTMVMTIIATAAVIPFLQTIMTKAGEDSYGAVRSAIHRLSGGEQRQPTGPTEPDGVKNVILHVPVNVQDDAIRRLTSMDLAALMQTSGASGIEVSWDDDRQEWKVVIQN
ncbi:tetratricopeptide repeat protein [Streptomyces anulatus]|uniref:tetratricopeptide repeat protein n=1 Tax=Streptomyces anulatus TaxID=1892 RepID=UPI002E2F16C9|nr:tetratricopeptide repeat protein [Streptomyces anulatus]WTD23109.1 hypothetical protein OH737_00505 [Streptomyces anulatus]